MKRKWVSKMKIKIGDKLVEVENGKIKATAKEIKRPDGRIDVVVSIPCLKIATKAEGE